MCSTCSLHRPRSCHGWDGQNTVSWEVWGREAGKGQQDPHFKRVACLRFPGHTPVSWLQRPQYPLAKRGSPVSPHPAHHLREVLACRWLALVEVTWFTGGAPTSTEPEDLDCSFPGSRSWTEQAWGPVPPGSSLPCFSAAGLTLHFFWAFFLIHI